MAKGGTYGINEVTLAPPVAGGYPTSWKGTGAFTFKAIVRDSVSFNDAAPSENDLYVEEIDDIYATLKSDEGSKGFTLDTYDLSEESYAALLNFSTDVSGAGTTSELTWHTEPTKQDFLIKAVQIITRELDDFPSKTFQWAKMKISVSKAGTIGKSGFPNFHLEFKQLANVAANGETVSGHRWCITPTDVLANFQQHTANNNDESGVTDTEVP